MTEPISNKESGLSVRGKLNEVIAKTNDIKSAAYSESSNFASASQGAKADTAVQPGDIGTAAYEDVGAFATAAQGGLADTALQPTTGLFRIATFAGAPVAGIPDAVDRVFVEDRGAHFRRVETEPPHALKFQNGSQWWEIDERSPNATQAAVVSDGYSDRNNQNASPTDDTEKVRAILAATQGPEVDLRMLGFGTSINEGIRYQHSNLRYVAGHDSPLVLAPDTTVDAMFAPAVWDEAAVGFPTAAYNDKIRGWKTGIALDGNIQNDGVAAIGYLSIPLGSFEYNFKIKNVSGTAYQLTHRNKADDASVTGNLLLNYMYGHSVENPADDPMTIGFLMGGDANGKLTDCLAVGLHAYAAKTGMRIGSAQGWHIIFPRIAYTDDALICYHSNRTAIINPVIDEFGRGYDTLKVSFTGIDLGGITDVDAGDATLIGGTVLGTAHAGDTSSFTYTGVSFRNSGAAIGKAILITGTHIHLDGTSAHTIALSQGSDSGNVNLTGVISDVIITGEYAGQTVETPFDVRSPYVKAHHVSHGKRLPFIGHNDRGFEFRNYDALDSLGGKSTDHAELRLSKAGVAVAASTDFAAVAVHAGGPLTLEVEVQASSAGSVGYVTRTRKVVFGVQRHSSGSNPIAGSAVEVFDTGSVSANAGVRAIDDITITATATSTGITLSAEVTASGSSAPTSVDLVWSVRASGLTTTVTGTPSVQISPA